MDRAAQSMDPYARESMIAQESVDTARSINFAIQYVAQTYMDRLVSLFTEQNHRPSSSIAQGGCLRDLPIYRFFATTLP